MKGLVYKSTGNWYKIKAADDSWWQSRLKGVLKIDDFSSTNPVAVGDEVEWEVEDANEKIGLISAILPRKNYIVRQSPQKNHLQHILAANIDQAVLIATLKAPKTSNGFIDRFLTTCEMQHIPAILLFNKADIYQEKEWKLWNEYTEIYTKMNYPVQLISIEKKENLNELSTIFNKKTTLLSGHSGVGKSSLINFLLPNKKLKTTDVSHWNEKGKHTTTFAEMYDIEHQGRIIDTPGIRELGIIHIEKEELNGYFRDMKERKKDCQFNNCMHLSEPNCGVKKAVQKNEISIARYESYLNILISIEGKTYL